MKLIRYSCAYMAVLTAMVPAVVNAQEDSVDAGVVEVKAAPLGGGMMIPDDTPKARSTVTKDAMDKMSPALNALEKMKYIPGININSNDSTGVSGFDFTMRGMTADQIGLSVDGIPMNDSGNFAMYPNLLGDSENIAMGFATQGTNEADAPHLGSSGGNVGFVTVAPEKEHSVLLKQTLGSNQLTKSFIRINTGEYKGFSAWVSASHRDAHKWKGDGRIRVENYEMNAQHDLGDGNSTKVIMKYSRQNNYNYNTVSKEDFKNEGRRVDYPTDVIMRKDGVNVQSNYRLFRNPFENFDISIEQNLKLADNLTLQIKPYYWWGNGGGNSGQSATYIGRNYSSGMDYDFSNLPKAGQSFYRPSWTQTWRPGIENKLDWYITPENHLTVGYIYERARQLQTQPYITIDNKGKPDQLWGQAGKSDKYRDALGCVVQGRDQYTITPTHKVMVQDTWDILPELQITAGLAYNWAKRKGRFNGSMAEPRGPYRERTYHKWLPNLSVSYRLNDNNQIFYNLSRNFRIPMNYVLYNGGDSIDIEAETAWNHEIGWKYTGEDMLVSATLYYLRFNNRIISSQDEEGNYEMMNMGRVENKGLELEWSGNLPYHFNYYASYSYNDSKQKDDVFYQGAYLPTSGHRLPNSPRHIANLILGYDDGIFYGNIIGKYVSKQYGDATNDESIPDHAVFDLNAGVRLPVDKRVFKEAGLNLSANNLFDKKYLSSARTTPFSTVDYGQSRGAGKAFYNVGEERTIAVTLSAKF